MQSKAGNRRQFLTTTALGAAAGVAGLAALSGCQPKVNESAAAAPAPAPAGLPRERYEQYVNWFNQNDPQFLEFYHPDVVLELGNATLEGANAIRDFYAEVKTYIKETVTINHYISDATGVAAEIPTEFKVIKDWPEPNYFKRPLKAGEVMRVISFGIYWMEDGKFRRIKAARYKLVNEWKMEA